MGTTAKAASAGHRADGREPESSQRHKGGQKAAAGGETSRRAKTAKTSGDCEGIGEGPIPSSRLPLNFIF
jgi:hypothetical protein